ncbi:glutamic acid-rich protein-like [Patiria miniata]|uniref:Death domain-containing protein n=1 Tax=Patiria miniata TaxID=46514 RepID=A0A913ZPB3_PATMI|nr:glutamic acid-rich protein-like [Patiria miniata]
MTDRDEAAQNLRRALEAIGLTDLAQNVPVTSKSRDEAAGPESVRLQDAGVDEENKQNGAASAEEENVKNKVSKGKSAIDDEYLKGLSPKIESSWKELAKHLGYEEVEIADIQTTNEGSTEESRHMLLTWWKKTTDRDEAAQKLRRALEAIGLTDFAQNVPVMNESRDESAGAEPERCQDAGVDEESKQQGAASTEEKKLKREQVDDQDKPQLIRVFIIFKDLAFFQLCNLLTLNDCGIHQDENISLRLSTDGLLGGGPKGFEEAEIKEIQTTSQENRERSLQMLLSWWRKQTNREEGFQSLTDALYSTGHADLALMITEQQEPKQEEQRGKPQPEVNEGGAKEQSKEKGTTSFEDQTPKQREVGHRDKRKKTSQMGGAKKRKQQKETSSSEGQRQRQEDVAEQSKPQTPGQGIVVKDQDRQKRARPSNEEHSPSQGLLQKKQKLGQFEKTAQKGMTSSGEPEPRHGQLECLRGKPRPEIQVRGAKQQSNYEETTSSKDQRPKQEEVNYRDKAELNVEEGGTKEQSKQKGTTSSEGQKQKQQESSRSQQEAAGRDPSVQMLQSSEDQGLKWSTHQKQEGVAPRNPSEIQETVIIERTSQDQQIIQSPSPVQDIAPSRREEHNPVRVMLQLISAGVN